MFAVNAEPQVEAILQNALSDIVGQELTHDVRKEVERRLEARILIVNQLLGHANEVVDPSHSTG